MPGKPTSGNRTGVRGKPTRVRRRLSKDAARKLAAEMEWATEDMQDEILSELIIRAPREWWDVATEVAREMGLNEAGRILDETGKPIIV